MPGLHIQCVPLTFLEKFVAAASHVFMFFFFFNAHLWDLGTPKMDGKGCIAHHRK